MPYAERMPQVGLGQLWRAPDGQHYAVVAISKEMVALNQASAAGRVLDIGYALNRPVERVRAEWVFVKA